MLRIKDWLLSYPLPRLEARMLMQKATGLTRTQLISHDEEYLNIEQEGQLNKWAQQRLEGRPMAYIMGEREFYGRSFNVTDAVLIPRPETEHLIDAVLEKLPTEQCAKIWDIGTGSGIIAITLKLERPKAEVLASDLSEDALIVAENNAKNLGAKVSFAQGSWFEHIPAYTGEPTFDFIVSNPPYIRHDDPHLAQGDVRFEPQIALTDFSDGLSAYRVLIQGALPLLKTGGWLVFEHGFDQKEAIQSLFNQFGYQQISTIEDLAGLNRISLAQK